MNLKAYKISRLLRTFPDMDTSDSCFLGNCNFLTHQTTENSPKLSGGIFPWFTKVLWWAGAVKHGPNSCFQKTGSIARVDAWDVCASGTPLHRCRALLLCGHCHEPALCKAGRLSGDLLRWHHKDWCFSIHYHSSKWHDPKDPAVLKTLRDSELLRRSVFTTPPPPPQIYQAANPSLRGELLVKPREIMSGKGLAMANHCAIVNLLWRRIFFSAAGCISLQI